MYKSDVLSHYGNKQSAVAAALNISRAAVNKWPEVVPEGSAYKLQAVTGGALQVNPALYLKPKQVA